MSKANERSIPVQDLLVEALRGLDFQRTRLRFLLGTDEFIPQEARVALAPVHLARLKSDLQGLGLELDLVVVSGAGARARPPFTDEDYRAVGAQVVSAEETASLPAFDVVHSLKEPTHYEAALAGPFLRIGALHLASKPPGLCALVQAKNVAAIFDGATVGSCSYLLHRGDRTPIVGSMSRFAGSVAARKAVAALEKRGIGKGRVVVVGGGIAGQSAIKELKAVAAPLVVVEPWEPMHTRLQRFFAEQGLKGAEIVTRLGEDTLKDAVAVVFAHRSGARAAEKVCTIDQIRTMRKGAAISDIAIDQGGSIAHPGYEDRDDAVVAREKYIALLGEDYSYYAEVNMPREEPHDASLMHGDASLPYVTALLALLGHLGTAGALCRYILSRELKIFTDPNNTEELGMLDAFVQDLRNGLQLAFISGELRLTDPDIAKDPVLAGWIRSCATGR